MESTQATPAGTAHDHSARDLEPVQIFGSLNATERDELAQKAGDIHLATGDFLNREGEPAFFRVLLEGQLSLHKNFNGRLQELKEYGQYHSGDFMGEIPLLLGANTFALLKADSKCRLARLDAQIFHKLIRSFPECCDLIMAVLTARLLRLAHFFRKPRPRALSSLDPNTINPVETFGIFYQ